jgi:hypothetical protein
MGEFTIVLGLIIFVTIVIMHNRSRTIVPCDEYVTYFDKVYYKLPKLHVEATEQPASLNDSTAEVRLPPAVAGDTNEQSSRWAGSVESQPPNNVDNIRQTTNVDVTAEPTTLQSGVKANNYLSQSKEGFRVVKRFV